MHDARSHCSSITLANRERRQAPTEIDEYDYDEAFFAEAALYGDYYDDLAALEAMLAEPKIETTTTPEPKVNVHSDDNDEIEFVETVFEKLLQEEFPEDDVEILEAGFLPLGFSFAILSILLLMAPAQNTEQTVPQLFTELQKSIQKQDYESVIKVSNKILHTKEGYNDQDALRCKTIAQIELEKYADAIKSLNQTDNELHFEKAYCFYRIQNNEKALEILEKFPDDEKCNELRAQLYFRLERWEEAFEIYQDALRNTVDNFEPERIANMIACAAMVSQYRPGTVAEKKELSDNYDPRVTGDTYEAAFNNACRLTGAGDYENAQEELVRAEQLCRSTAEDFDEDVGSELVGIRFQSGYIKQVTGKVKEAKTAYNLVIDTSNDPLYNALANHNLGTLNKADNILDSRKKFKSIQATNIDAKLVGPQRTAATKNRALLALYSGKPAECRKILGKIATDDDVINASILFQEKEYIQASAELLKWGQQNAQAELAAIKAASMFIEAQYKIDSGDTEAAALMLEEIHKAEPNNLAVVAELINAYSKIDPKKAAVVSSRLPSLEELTADLDLEDIETWAKQTSYKKVVKKVDETKQEAKIADEAAPRKTKSKKKKKPRYPKNFDPEAPNNAAVDPYRWMPLRERPYYKGP
ncbi:Oidioi.mRNA.OKI2018_I69.PAR.g12142.t1.cds [Oikopleura dioica]|uniref:Signal recognition particle subunit SRP72 n=1 Tax=Oikopleura dioica TaxID=34765 RepID=A0ABN7S237_OIKDI|nr:Oidioi.mRNA.OKI2018_I69.PAR.g12142.t1.cds [Oikopleura dioica]